MKPELDLLRPALEMAYIVARQGETDPVPIPAPQVLRPFLRFSRYPPRALAAAHRALENDEFRQRVASKVDEEEVGSAGWLFLTRPENWDRDVGELVAEHKAVAVKYQERSAAREAERLQALAIELQERIDALEVEHRAAAERFRSELEEKELRRRSAESERDDAHAKAAEMADQRSRAVRELKAMERRLADRTAELRTERAERTKGTAEEPAQIAETLKAVNDERRHQRTMIAELASRLADVAAVVEEMGSALSSPGGVGASIEADAAASETQSKGRMVGRVPTAMSSGLVEGTIKGSSWLLSCSGALVLIDGYNVSMSGWSDLSAGEQRAALERGCGEVQHRTGAQIVVIFDGEGAGTAIRSAVGSPVRVRFTDPDVEADDEILELVDQSTAPVLVVVSSDRRVRDGARVRGANVISSREFLDLVRQP